MLKSLVQAGLWYILYNSFIFKDRLYLTIYLLVRNISYKKTGGMGISVSNPEYHLSHMLSLPLKGMYFKQSLVFSYLFSTVLFHIFTTSWKVKVPQVTEVAGQFCKSDYDT